MKGQKVEEIQCAVLKVYEEGRCTEMYDGFLFLSIKFSYKIQLYMKHDGTKIQFIQDWK